MRTLPLALLIACAAEETPEANILAGGATDFEATDVDGSTFRLSDHSGDVILIDMSLHN